MKNTLAEKPFIQVAVVESDPLRMAGFKAVLDSEPDLRLRAITLAEISAADVIDVVLVGGRSGHNAFRDVEMLRLVKSDLRVIVTGSGVNDSTILDTLACGAKGYVDEAAPVTDFVKAIRIVADGLIWAPRRVLAAFIDRASNSPGLGPAGRIITSRENKSWTCS